MPAPKGNKYAKGNKGGRPTKFKPEYIKKLIEFFSIEPYKKELMESSTEYYKDGEVKRESAKYKHMPNKMPTIYSFSKSIDVAYSTVFRWAEKGQDDILPEDTDTNKKWTKEELEAIELNNKAIKEFCNAYKEAKEAQKEFLISIGLAGAAPAPFAIFTAKNVTDMRDKVETDITSGGEKIQPILGMKIVKEDEA